MSRRENCYAFKQQAGALFRQSAHIKSLLLVTPPHKPCCVGLENDAFRLTVLCDGTQRWRADGGLCVPTEFLGVQATLSCR